MSGELQIRVGRNLRAYRERMGLSQEAFAYELDVHRTYMGGVERGERNITLRSLERIAAQLGVDPVELMAPIEGLEPGGGGESGDAGDVEGAAGAGGAGGAGGVEDEPEEWWPGYHAGGSDGLGGSGGTDPFSRGR